MKRFTIFFCIFLLLNFMVKIDAARPVYTTSSGGQSMNQAVEVRPPIYCTSTGGCGYEASRRAPYRCAAVAFAAVMLAAIIAIALQKESAALHSHTDSSSN